MIAIEGIAETIQIAMNFIAFQELSNGWDLKRFTKRIEMTERRPQTTHMNHLISCEISSR
jgi:hypothetical protein